MSPLALLPRSTCLLLLVLGSLLAPNGRLRAQSPEHQIKAVFLLNFAHFVEWPPQAFPDDSTPLIIGVIGSDPFGETLEDAIQGELAHGRPLTVRRYRRIAEVDTCHILFFPSSERPRWSGLRADLHARAILTVGESDGFARAGGMIEFVRDHNRIRLRINRGAAQAAGLQLSSKLLRAGELVDERGPRS